MTLNRESDPSRRDREWLRKMSPTRGDMTKLILGAAITIVICGFLVRELVVKPIQTTERSRPSPQAPRVILQSAELEMARSGAETTEEPGDGGWEGEGATSPGPVVAPGPAEGKEPGPPKVPGPPITQALRRVVDNSDTLEWEACFSLACWAKGMTLDGIRSLALREVSWDEVYLKPKEYRGRVIRVAGRLMRLREMPLDPENPCGLIRAYHGQIVDKDRRFWTFIVVNRPDDSLLEDHQVAVYGAFMKSWEYETRQENVRKRTNVIVGPQLVEVIPEKFETLSWVVVGLVAALLIALFVILRFEWREDAGVDAARRQKLKERRPAGLNEMARTLAARAAEKRDELFRPGSDTADGAAAAGTPVAGAQAPDTGAATAEEPADPGPEGKSTEPEGTDAAAARDEKDADGIDKPRPPCGGEQGQGGG